MTRALCASIHIVPCFKDWYNQGTKRVSGNWLRGEQVQTMGQGNHQDQEAACHHEQRRGADLSESHI